MTFEAILRLYSGSDKTLQITEKLQSQGNSHVHLKGISGSAGAFIAAAVASSARFEKGRDRDFLIVLPDQEEAAYFLNDLENLTGQKNILFFPSPSQKPYFIEKTDNANVLLRSEVLNTIAQANNRNEVLSTKSEVSGTKNEVQSTKDNEQRTTNNEQRIIIVSYPEALAEKVVTKVQLSKNTLQLMQGEKISIDFIHEVLYEYGFERTDYVHEPGQFSTRGGIIDVFSFSNENPYRIELSGDDVDSIRSFDAASQLSIEKLQQISIIPNLQTKLLQENRESFFDYVSKNTIIWIKDARMTKDKIQKEFDLAKKTFDKLSSIVNHLPPEELFIDGELFEKQASSFSTVEFGNKFYFNSDLTVQYNFSLQPSFNKNFDLLAKNLEENANKGFQNILFSDTEKQTERLKAIFEDLETSPQPSPDGEEMKAFSPILLSIHEGFIDKDLKIACYTDHQIFDRYHRFRLKNSFHRQKEALTLRELKGLKPGDFVTHIDHGIGRYGGLEKIEVNGRIQEAIRLVYKDQDILYISIHSLHRIAKYSGKEGAVPRIDKLGSNAWNNLKQKTKKKVKEIAFDLIKLYAERKAKKGFAFSPDTYMQTELEASFIYEDTPDQLKSTQDVKRDMEAENPMDRLICGDVGFGKTEIAIRAAFKAVADSKQVAVLVPTTILALQHYRTFSERLKDLPCKVDYINRFKSIKEQKETLKNLEEGKIDIIIGTHRIVGKDIQFKDLGLLIVDEEQKFGVGVKEKLKTIRVNVDTLTLTATPIPRTLQFSMMGARDLSIINTPPPNRYPVQTEVHDFDEEIIRDAITHEISRGGQVFFVHNRIQSMENIIALIGRLCPNVKVLAAHGQMEGDKVEKAMMEFINGDYDVLVSTSIVESGLDITNANTMIINNAQLFGLSDLHQLRGRVGRSNKKAFSYLLTPPHTTLTDEARKRLKAIEEFSDLGSGFHIAMRDLDIRGAGDLLGAEQSGFITEIGFEMYQKILDEAMDELQIEHNELQMRQSPDRQFIKDCVIDTDLEILIPDDYVTNITERLSLYKELDESRREEDLVVFEMKLKDRFGPIPAETLELINTIKLRWLAIEAGFEKIALKNNKLAGYFISKKDSPYFNSELFTGILQFVQHNSGLCNMKETNNKLLLVFENIKGIDAAIAVLNKVLHKEKALLSKFTNN